VGQKLSKVVDQILKLVVRNKKKVKYKTEVSRLSELQRIKTRSLNAGQHWSAGLGRKV